MSCTGIKRLRLFARDYFSEFGCAWSVARSRDCERAGGHRWGETAYDDTMAMWGQECARCGTWQSALDSLFREEADGPQDDGPKAEEQA